MKTRARLRIELAHMKKNLLIWFRPSGVIIGCGALVILSAIALLETYRVVGSNTGLFNLVFAVTTGVSASAVVTIIAEAVHNTTRNLKRLNALEGYFHTVGHYSHLVTIAANSMGRMAREDGVPSSSSEAWRQALEDLEDPYDADTYTQRMVAAIANKVGEVREMCDLCRANVELLGVKELTIITEIWHEIQFIEQLIRLALLTDDSVHDFKLELTADLHEIFGPCEDGAENSDPELNDKYQQLLAHFSARNMDDLCQHLSTLDDICSVRDFVAQLFPDEDLEYSSDSEQDNYPYPELVYPGAFEKLQTELYESEAIRHFKKMRLIGQLSVERFRELAHEYMTDYLENPTFLSRQERADIATELMEIDRLMHKLERIVRKEPFVGEIMDYYKRVEKDHLKATDR